MAVVLGTKKLPDNSPLASVTRRVGPPNTAGYSVAFAY